MLPNGYQMMTLTFMGQVSGEQDLNTKESKQSVIVNKRRKTLTNQKGIYMKHIYEVDHDKQVIAVTKRGFKLAGTIGSDAYRDLAQARHDYPDYPVVQREIAKSSRKKTYGRLTYEEMKIHIQAKEGDNAETVLNEFDRIKILSKSYRFPYAYVRKWFLTKYADDFEIEEESA